MSSAASRRQLNAAISSLVRLGRSRRLDELHATKTGVGLNFAAYGVLDKIVEAGQLRMSELACLLQMAPNALSRQVRLLEDRGEVVRRFDRKDARVMIVEATRQGKETHFRFREGNDRMLSRQLANWTSAEIDELSTQIERLVRDLRQVTDER
jgi:DNA-binding MarR family transcriptional regulator